MIHFQVFYLWWKKIWHSLYEWLITFLNSLALSLQAEARTATHTRSPTHTHICTLSLSLSQGSLNHQLKGVADDKVFSTKGGKKSRLKSEKDFNQVLLLSFFLSPTTLRHETKKNWSLPKNIPKQNIGFLLIQWSFLIMLFFQQSLFLINQVFLFFSHLVHPFNTFLPF